VRVMIQIHAWDKELSYSYLKHLFGTTPNSATSKIDRTI
jgi:hypothetical protein